MICEPDSALVHHLHASPNYNQRFVKRVPEPVEESEAAAVIKVGLDRKARTSAATVAAVQADMLLLHYTGMVSCAKAIDWLSRPEANVSCHYVIDTDGTITQMVAEEHRAWHAGAGSWGADKDINAVSIGIEIHNLGHDLGYPDFPDRQMQAVAALAKDIVQRNGIAPARVLGHSDIAPMRKGDPGEKFDWAGLAAKGVGYWREPIAVDGSDAGIGLIDDNIGTVVSEGVSHSPDTQASAQIATVRHMLARFGYCIQPGISFDLVLQKTLLAFQRHYRPARCDGHLDLSTIATLQQLLDGLDGELGSHLPVPDNSDY